MVFCQKCGGEPIHGKRICRDCLINAMDARRVVASERRKLGLCVTCGLACDDDRFMNCGVCRQRFRDKDRFKREVSSIGSGHFVEPPTGPARHADVIAFDCEPTKATPGSEEKIQVLSERYEAGKMMFHPKDETRFSRVGRVKVIQEEFDDDDDCYY